LTPITVVGTPVSPYVRKVLVCLELKGLSYEIDPVAAFYTGVEFEEANPLRLIPVLIDGPHVISDSTVICEYLEDAYPENPVLPLEPAQRAKARWFDEYADTQLADVLLWKLFNEAIINPSVWGVERDLNSIEKIISEDIPVVLAYLEGMLPENGFLFGDMCLADISIAVHFRNAAWARFQPAKAEWPITSAFVQRVLTTEVFQKLMPVEDALIRTPIPQQRAALKELGVALADQSFMTRQKPSAGPRTTLRR
jgi:glutathione S-transferase